MVKNLIEGRDDDEVEPSVPELKTGRERKMRQTCLPQTPVYSKASLRVNLRSAAGVRRNSRVSKLSMKSR